MGHYLTITKWKPNFKPVETAIHTTLVWIRFPTLPLEMFDDNSMLGIANVVGKAVRVDSHSVDRVKGKYARVCVELDLNATLVPNVLVWGKRQPVEYEGLPHICFSCGKHGHNQEHCRTHREDTSPGPEQLAPRVPQEPTSAAAQPFGPWMLPAHVRRHQEQMKASMNRQSIPSEANRRLNAQIEHELRTAKDPRPSPPPDPTLDGSQDFVFGSAHSNRGKQPMSATPGEDGSHGRTAGGTVGSRTKFSALADVQNVEAADLDLLKQKIQDISYGLSKGGHTKAHIKLERGLHSHAASAHRKPGLPPLAHRKDTPLNRQAFAAAHGPGGPSRRNKGPLHSPGPPPQSSNPLSTHSRASSSSPSRLPSSPGTSVPIVAAPHARMDLDA